MHLDLSSLTVLLVQARSEPEIEAQEQVCFSDRSRLPLDRFRCVNVVRDSLTLDLLDGVDAIMIGGAGEFSATRDYPWMDALLALVRAAVHRDVPTFGSCWGHQIIARALGGTVIHDGERAEMGCHPVELTPEGRRDPLFRSFPATFMANMGHHDRVLTLPPDGIELARNASQPNEAFRIRGKACYGTQFHSELDSQRERERLITYRSYYLREFPDEETFNRVLDSLAETTEVDHLLHDFLRLIVLERVSSAI